MKTIRNIIAWIALWAIMVVPCFARTKAGVIRPDGRNTISSLVEKQNGNVRTTAPYRVHPQGIHRLPKTTFAYRGVYTKKGFVLTSIWPAKSVKEMDLKIAQQNAKKSKKVKHTLLAKGKKKKPSLVSNRGAGKAPIAQKQKPQPIQPPKPEIVEDPKPIPSSPEAEPIVDQGAKAPITYQESDKQPNPVPKAIVPPVSSMNFQKPTDPIVREFKEKPVEPVAEKNNNQNRLDYGPALNFKTPPTNTSQIPPKSTVPFTEIEPENNTKSNSSNNKNIPERKGLTEHELLLGGWVIVGILTIIALIVRRDDIYYFFKRQRRRAEIFCDIQYAKYFSR